MLRTIITSLVGLSSIVYATNEPVPYILDISQGEQRPVDYWLKAGGTNPQGEKLGVNSLYWTRNDQPWTPAMGEFHYFRCPADLWETELLKMKAGGISIVATVLYWELAEPQPGQWDWTGDNDLRRFVQLCAKHGLLVWLRCGPYINAEIVRGGIPAWADKDGKRFNAPWYLDCARQWYNQIGQQIKGLLYKDGGPIIGIQLENEFANGSKDHPAELKRLAIEAGLIAPFYSATANTMYHFERGDIIPLLAAYPYRFWQAPAPTSDFLYMTDEWGAMENLGRLYYDATRIPRGACEVGSGCLNSYQDRYQVPVYDMETNAQTVLGRGVNLVGYYMYHGGSNREGWPTSICPLNYDYQAPIGEFGQIRPSFHVLKLFHMFMNDFGHLLGPTQPVRSNNMVAKAEDVSRVRHIGRFNGDSGFIFMNTCQPWVKTHAIDNVQFEVKLSSGTMKVPAKPITVPANTCPVFPVNLDMNGCLLRYATARLLALVPDNDGIPTYIFSEEIGISPEFRFSNTVEIQNGSSWKDGQDTVCRLDSAISATSPVMVTSPSGKRAKLILLPRNKAEHAWRFTYAGKPRLVISDCTVVENMGVFELTSTSPRMEFEIFPAIDQKFFGKSPENVGSFSRIQHQVPTVEWKIDTTKLPAKSWETPIAKELPNNVVDILYKATYTGSTADLFADSKKYTDNRHIGAPFEWSIKRFINFGTNKITVTANRWDPQVKGIPQADAPNSPTEEQGMIRKVSAHPIYQIRFVPDKM